MAHMGYTCPAKSLLSQLGHRKYMDFCLCNFSSPSFAPFLDKFSNIVILRVYLSLRVQNKISQQLKQ